MIAKLRAIWASDSTSVLIGALTIGMGLKLLQEITEKRTGALAEVTEQLAAGRTQLHELTDKHQAFMAQADEQRALWRMDLAARSGQVGQVAEVDR